MRLDALSGNEPLKRQLSAQLEGRGLSHAYLISGPAGSGKGTLARLLAQAMVCTGQGDRPCGLCAGCKKAAAGIHPDVTVLGADGRDIKVEQARAIRADAYIRPNEAPRKVYLIENAQNLNQSAQNALLKLLEEGPAYAAFLLTAENPGALLPTVRSRCELLALSPPGEAPAAEGGEAEEAAWELLELLVRGDELELAAWCVGHEKWDRDALSRLFAREAALLGEALALKAGVPGEGQVREGLRRASALPERRLLRSVEALEELGRAAEYNVGAGHLCGALCASLSRIRG